MVVFAPKTVASALMDTKRLLAVDGEDLRPRPLIERKRRLRSVMPESRVAAEVRRSCSTARDCVIPSHVRTRLEGVVAKWRRGRYEDDGVSTSWLKTKNPSYSQWEGRRELFEERRDRRQHSRRDWRAPILRLTLPDVDATLLRAFPRRLVNKR